ncbi:shikimate kinase [Candidatus Bathyarchaeota archaeon]|nr:shikimate kinase [Candidatus Bathyarchaeota archaeon]
MGVGKSTVGKLLAHKKNYAFIDVDEEIVKEQRKKISEIFTLFGENEFRKIEKKKIVELKNFDKHIIACGGGAVIDPENVSNLKLNSMLIYLTAEPKTILQRLEQDDTRPLLKNGNKLTSIEEILGARREAYQRISDITIATDYKTPEEVATIIYNKLGEIK